jgi:predicted Zn-dependent protease with MMP-like domain
VSTGDFSDKDWSHCLKLAQAEVEATLNSLPAELRVAVRKVALTYEHVPNAALMADGIEPDTLGLFVGDPWPDCVQGRELIPSQIILFLQNIWEVAEADEESFKGETHTTLMHELGHYLGLDEDDLDERGLA